MNGFARQAVGALWVLAGILGKWDHATACQGWGNSLTPGETAPSTQSPPRMPEACNAQTLGFGAAPTVVVGGQGTVIATTDATPAANYPITFSTTSTDCSVTSTGTVSGIHASTNNCTITASQSGDSNFGPATATLTFTIGKGSQTVSWSALTPANHPFVSAGTFQITPLAISSAGLPVTYASQDGSVCTVNGAVVTMLSAGLCPLEAMQNGDADYNAAATVYESVIITAASQTITFPAQASGSRTFASGGTFPINPQASASSGLTVTYSVVAASATICSISGATVTMLSAGICTIAADQAGNASYTAAAQVTQNVIIDSATSSVSLSASPTNATAGQTIALTATVFGDPPSGIVTFYDGATTLGTASLVATSATSSVATLSIGTLTPGIHALSAAYSGDGNNQASVSAAVTVAVNVPPVAAPMFDRWAMMLFGGLLSLVVFMRRQTQESRVGE